jgi:serine/threonine protein kinase
MDAERLRQIEELYHSAMERAPGEREAFLKEACTSDPELLQAVSSLVLQDPSGDPIERPVLQIAASLLSDLPAAHWAPGILVGPYEIVSRLGEGGMGEVYKARDTRLGREVAIKTAHEEFSGRFQREARAISSLNHPNICTLHDIGPNYLVMELVQGANLAGPVSIDTAIGYARQIAAGLEAAHEKGVIHRDLKPANIKVTPEGAVKILDFGLARATEAPVAAEGATSSMTDAGVILGTAAYMSPEQARGEAVDKRTDIWAFGVILHELLTGKRLFGDSRSVSDTIAAVLTREPDFNTLPNATPPRLRRLLERCLRKDPKQRLRDIGDARILLDEPEPEALGPRAIARRWPWVAGSVALLALAVFGTYRWLTERPAAPFQRIQISRLTDSGKATAAAISPDGKYVVYAVTGEETSSLWMLQTATESHERIMPPARGSYSNLRFSRDGNSLYYVFDTGKSPAAMYTKPVLGSVARTLASFGGLTTYGWDTVSSMSFASLSPDEKRLAFKGAGNGSGLFIVDLDGGGQRQLAPPKPESYDSTAWSPDGKTLAYGVSMPGFGPDHILAVTPVAGGPEKRINLRAWQQTRALLWLPDGHGLVAVANAHYPIYQVWYVSYPGGQTRSVTNDLHNYSGLSATGDAGALVTVQNETTSHIWVVAPGVPGSEREISTGRLDALGLNGIAWAGNANILFEAPDRNLDTQIWITAADGTGRRQITTGSGNGRPATCGGDRHLVFMWQSYRTTTPHIWRSDLDGGNVRPLTDDEGDFGPSCSPDGLWMTYTLWTTKDPERRGVYRKPIDGGAPYRIWERPGWSAISPDGELVLVNELVGAEAKVIIIPAAGGPPIKSFDPASELGGRGAVQWSADGQALLYVKTVESVSNVWRRPLAGGQPKPVTSFTRDRITSFAVSPDGKRLALGRGKTSSDVVMLRDIK